MVFAAVRTHFPCLVDRTTINEQLFKYNNEHNLIGNGRLVEWIERSPSIQAVESVREEFLFSFLLFLFSFFFFW